MALPLFWDGLPLFTSALKTSKQLKKIFIPLLISCCISILASAQISQNNSLAQLDSAFGPQSFFDGHLSGFMLYDLESKQVVFEKNSHLYQIPASTVKLLTLYGALQVLQDSTQTLRYQSAGDTLKIWGSGDPSWKYKDFYQPDFQKIIGNHSIVQFSDANQISPSFGYGWQWDDYYFDYAAERSTYKKFLKVKSNHFYNALQVKYSYAVTCHKSQGGQWEHVFVEKPYLAEGPNKDYMRWLYTAITRATKHLYLLGFPNEDFNVIE